MEMFEPSNDALKIYKTFQRGITTFMQFIWSKLTLVLYRACALSSSGCGVACELQCVIILHPPNHSKFHLVNLFNPFLSFFLLGCSEHSVYHLSLSLCVSSYLHIPSKFITNPTWFLIIVWTSLVGGNVAVCWSAH